MRRGVLIGFVLGALVAAGVFALVRGGDESSVRLSASALRAAEPACRAFDAHVDDFRTGAGLADLRRQLRAFRRGRDRLADTLRDEVTAMPDRQTLPEDRRLAVSCTCCTCSRYRPAWLSRSAASSSSCGGIDASGISRSQERDDSRDRPPAVRRPVYRPPVHVPAASADDLSPEELEALRGAAAWYAKYHAVPIAELADDPSAYAEVKREKFLTLVAALRKLGFDMALPDELRVHERQAA